MKKGGYEFTALMTLVLVGGIFFLLAGQNLAQEKRSRVIPPEARELKNLVLADAASLSAGKDLYDEHCLMCHGKKGKGDGPMADTLPRSPGDLTDKETIGKLTDGELFWRISKGDDVMPSFETENPLPEEDRWRIVNYVRILTDSTK